MTANLHVTKINGNLAYYDSIAHNLIEAIGPDVVKVIMDFVGDVHYTSPSVLESDLNWTVTRVEAGAGESTIAVVDGVGGILRITTDAAENDGINAQLIGEAFEFTSDQVLCFAVKGCKLSDATQSDFFLGLSITDTDILGGVTDAIGFQKVDGSADLTFIQTKNSSTTTSSGLATLADATAFDLLFYWDGTAGTVSVYVNNVLVAAPVTTNLPNDEFLRISWQFLAGAAASKTMDIDKLTCIMIGR